MPPSPRIREEKISNFSVSILSVAIIIPLGAEASAGPVMIKFGSCKYTGPTPAAPLGGVISNNLFRFQPWTIECNQGMRIMIARHRTMFTSVL